MSATRAEEIDAELEQLRTKLCCGEDWPGPNCDCTVLREQIHRLTAERDDIPRPRTPGAGRDTHPARQS